MTTVLLVRHGETAWNVQGRVQGWAPTGLTDRGHEQARALGEHVATAYDVDEVVASDLRRTRETAERVVESVDAAVRFDPGWRERDFGVYQGFTYEELEDHRGRSGDGGTGGAAGEPESGESRETVRERVLDAWEAAIPGDGGSILVVTHGGPLYVMLGHIKGLGPGERSRLGSQENCAVNEVRIDGEGPRLVRENATDHLDGS